jgi:hypothetical protein
MLGCEELRFALRPFNSCILLALRVLWHAPCLILRCRREDEGGLEASCVSFAFLTGVARGGC